MNIIDRDKVMPNLDVSIHAGGILPLGKYKNSLIFWQIQAICEKYDVDLYTGSDTSSLPHIHNRGFAKTLTEMPIIFHESKINLNMTAKPIRTGIPQRIWDVFGSEGFLISNYQSEIPEYFVPGEDIVLYDSPETLMEQTDYYLRHENERKEIAHNAFEKTLEYHTYEKRVELMLESL